MFPTFDLASLRKNHKIHSILYKSKLLGLVVYFVEPDKTSLWAVWAEQYEIDNLQYNTLVRWANGTNGLSTNRLMVLIISYRRRALKTFYLHFCNFMKRIRKQIERDFAKNFERFYEKKKIILGTSDTWSTICLSHRPSEPVYHIVDWRI